MTEIREKLGWFDTQLHLQIRDEEIERGGGSLVTYFDTSDVRDAVLGLQAFFALDKTFDLALFRPRRVLVRCLATSGWLAKFEMLPPHQSEFLSLLNLDFGFGKDSGWVSTERVQEFMNRLGLREILDEARVSLTKLNKGELVGFVKRRALSAETLFRALQCARGGNWVVRLASLRKRGLIGIGPSGVDYGEVIASKHFGALRDAFNHRRPDKAVNNFADAAALSILLLQVEAFSRGLSKCLPRLFDSRGTFREVLDGVGHGIPDSLVESVQGADYFIFRAAFRPPVDVGRSSEEGGSRLDDLLSLRGQIQEILGAQSKLTAEDVDNIKVSGRPLTKVIDDLQRLSFLENVWLPFHAETDVEAMVKELDDLARQESTRTFKDGLEAAIKEVKEAIRLNVLEYQRLDSLWRELERGFQRIRARVSARGKMIDVFRDFALLRFSFPRSTRQAIVNVVEGLLAEGEQVQRDARVSVIDAFFKGRKDRGDVDTLALAASVLWIAELDSYVEVLLGGNSRLPHFSLQIVYAASIFRRRIGIGIGRTLLSSLESLYRETQDRRQKAELAVGIAYLKYHYWRSIGGCLVGIMLGRWLTRLKTLSANL